MQSVSQTPSVSVVIPCFNEKECVRQTVDQVHRVADALEADIVVVDDGSTDGSSALLDEMASSGRYPRLSVVRHRSNQGYGAAIKTGIRRSSGELLVITDADGTYPHLRIPELVAAVDGVDMVVGARVGDDVQYPVMRRLPKVFLQAYTSWLVGERIPDMNSGLRVFRRVVAERFFNVLPDGFSLTTTLTVGMMRGRYAVRFVPISYASRVGRSKIRPIHDTLRIVQLILRTGMYFAPLRVLLPLVGMLSLAFSASLAYDVLVLADLTEKTLLLLLLAMNTGLFALLADMIDKRS